MNLEEFKKIPPIEHLQRLADLITIGGTYQRKAYEQRRKAYTEKLHQIKLKQDERKTANQTE